MKKLLTTLAALTALMPVMHAATTFNFDGADLTTTVGPSPAAVTIQSAYWETQDENGDPLVTPGFRPDVSTTVIAADPSTMGYGPAISGNAIDGTNGPIMFTFSTSFTLSNFSIALDNSTFGNVPTVGGEPAFGTNILFYDSSDNLIAYIGVDQTVAGFTVNDAGTYANVSKIVLPGGAYYDNLSFTSVPEPSAALLVGLGVVAAFARRRK